MAFLFALMKTCSEQSAGFTLIELLVVLAIMAVLVVLFLPQRHRLGPRARMARCRSNLQPISQALQMFAVDRGGAPPRLSGIRPFFDSETAYRDAIASYVGIKSKPSPSDLVFACPSDKFFYDRMGNSPVYVPHPLHQQTGHAFASYSFNTNGFTSHAGGKPAWESVSEPSRTILIADAPASFPYSWHYPKLPLGKDNAAFTDAQNMVGFVDGHVGDIRVYFDGHTPASSQDPPAGYGYKWKAN
jgi:prepilin-type N-terminal cleavage/methylation domain-containing protein